MRLRLALNRQHIASLQRPLVQKRIRLPYALNAGLVSMCNRVQRLALLHVMLHGRRLLTRRSPPHCARKPPRHRRSVSRMHRGFRSRRRARRNHPASRRHKSSIANRAARSPREYCSSASVAPRSHQNVPQFLPAYRRAPRGSAPAAPPAGAVGTFNMNPAGTTACASR